MSPSQKRVSWGKRRQTGGPWGGKVPLYSSAPSHTSLSSWHIPIKRVQDGVEWPHSTPHEELASETEQTPLVPVCHLWPFCIQKALKFSRTEISSLSRLEFSLDCCYWQQTLGELLFFISIIIFQYHMHNNSSLDTANRYKQMNGTITASRLSFKTDSNFSPFVQKQI